MRHILAFAFLVGFASIGSPVTAQVACQPPAAGPPCGNPEFAACQIAVDGVQRDFCAHFPSSTPIPPAGQPAVIGYHGGSGDAGDMIAVLDHLTEQGIVLIAPTALENPRGGVGVCRRAWRTIGSSVPAWPDFNANNTCDGTPNDSDLALTEELLDGLEAQFEITDAYALGFSSGGGFVYQLLITRELADRFRGFGVIGIAMNEDKMAAQSGGTSGRFSANAQPNVERRPIMVIRGTDEKSNFPTRQVMTAVDAAVANGTCPTPALPSDVIRCFAAIDVAPGEGHNNLPLTLWDTRDWLVGFNASRRLGIESSYPDKGAHAQMAPGRQDDTIVVREDYLPAGSDSAAVSSIVIVGGRHVIAGVEGAHAPCRNASCDIRAVDEILDFWRAHAGFDNIWR